MIAYLARHTCGTEVQDTLPDGYPVDEGVGLYCPACREAFWHVGGEAEAGPGFLPPQPPDEAPVRRRRWSRA